MLKGHTDVVSLVAFSPDASRLVSISFGEIILWDVRSGQQLASFGVRGFLPFSLAFSPDGKLLAGGALRETRVWEVPTGRLLHTLPGHAEFVNVVSFSPDGKMLVTGSYNDEPVLLWDVTAGRAVQYDRLPKWAENVEMLRREERRHTTGIVRADGKRVTARPNGGQIDFVDTNTRDVLVSLTMLNDDDWLATTPNGFFDGSPEAWKRLRWRFDGDTFEHGAVELYLNDFFYPNLLEDALRGNAPAEKQGRELRKVDRRQPKVSITTDERPGAARPGTPPGDRMSGVVIEVTDNTDADKRGRHRGPSGARDLRLFRNGSLVKVWHDDLFKRAPGDGCQEVAPARRGGARRVRCRVDVRLVAGENVLTAHAFNGSNIKSDDDVKVVRGADALKRDGKLYLLAIGVNKYADASYNLNYAVPDVEAVSSTLTAQQGKLRQDSKLKQYAGIETIILADEDATKENILLTLRRFAVGDAAGIPGRSSAKFRSELAKIKVIEPEDAVVIYFAGHGTSRGERFYLLPHDYSSAGEDALGRRGVSDVEINEALEKVDAGRLLVVIDACQSGQALGKANEGRAPMNSKGLAQLAYDKGMYILAAAQSQQAALEGVLVRGRGDSFVRIENGLLTYALLKAFEDSGADKDGDKKLIEREWLDYAVSRVPQMQLESTQMRIAKGADVQPGQDRAKLGTVSSEGMSSESGIRGLQSPRIFYRRETAPQPFIIAKL